MANWWHNTSCVWTFFKKRKFQMSCVKTAAVWWEGAELGLSVNATAALMPLLFELSCGRSTSAASVEHRNMSEKENAAFFSFSRGYLSTVLQGNHSLFCSTGLGLGLKLCWCLALRDLSQKADLGKGELSKAPAGWWRAGQVFWAAVAPAELSNHSPRLGFHREM